MPPTSAKASFGVDTENSWEFVAFIVNLTGNSEFCPENHSLFPICQLKYRYSIILLKTKGFMELNSGKNVSKYIRLSPIFI